MRRMVSRSAISVTALAASCVLFYLALRHTPATRILILALLGAGVLLALMAGVFAGGLLWACVRRAGKWWVFPAGAGVVAGVSIYGVLSLYGGFPLVESISGDSVITSLALCFLVANSFVVGRALLPRGREIPARGAFTAAVLLYGSMLAGIVWFRVYPLTWSVPMTAVRETKRLPWENRYDELIVADASEALLPDGRVRVLDATGIREVGRTGIRSTYQWADIRVEIEGDFEPFDGHELVLLPWETRVGHLNPSHTRLVERSPGGLGKYDLQFGFGPPIPGPLQLRLNLIPREKVEMERPRVAQVRIQVPPIKGFPRENYGVTNLLDMRVPWRVGYQPYIVGYPDTGARGVPIEYAAYTNLLGGELGLRCDGLLYAERPLPGSQTVSVREALNRSLSGRWTVCDGKIVCVTRNTWTVIELFPQAVRGEYRYIPAPVGLQTFRR